jgi:hypothetical protein
MIIANSYSRAVTVPDPDGSLIPVWSCDKALAVYLSALAAAAGSSMTGRMFMFNSGHSLLSISEQFTFSVQTGAADYAGQWSGIPSFSPWQILAGVGLIGWKCDALQGGPWSIQAGVAYKVR